MVLDSLLHMLSELFILASSLTLLILGMVANKRLVCGLSSAFCGIAVAIACYELFHHMHEEVLLFNELILHNNYTRLSRLIIILATFAVLSLFFLSRRDHRYEFSVLVLLASLGAVTLVEANNFMSFYLSFELQGLASYVLVCLNRDSRQSSEAAVKFFVMGALLSCIMLYGVSLIYGYSTSLGFGILSDVLNGNAQLGAVLGCTFVLLTMLFKLSAVPFHMWAPDTYQGAPTLAMAFFLMVTKAAIVLLLTRIISSVASPIEGLLYGFMVLSVLSVVVGELGALRQSNVKRFLAYSNIGHLGYVLAGIASGAIAVPSIFQYVVTYAVINAWIFSLLLYYSDEGFEFANLSALRISNPFIAFSMTVAFISISGVPPFPGFFVKYSLLKAIIAGDIALGGVRVTTFLFVAFLCVMSVIPCFYCFRIARTVYFDEPEKEITFVNKLRGLSAISLACIILSVALSLCALDHNRGYLGFWGL